VLNDRARENRVRERFGPEACSEIGAGVGSFFRAGSNPRVRRGTKLAPQHIHGAGSDSELGPPSAPGTTYQLPPDRSQRNGVLTPSLPACLRGAVGRGSFGTAH